MSTVRTDTLLVGREAETGIVNDCIEALAFGRGRVLLLSGEPGIGKSTLARYAVDTARRCGIPAFWGFAWEAGGAPAYWPWTQLLRSLTAEMDLPDRILSALGELLPEIETRKDGVLHPDQARFLLLDSVRLMLEHVGKTGAAVLVLEDLHAADRESLHLLHYVGRHIDSLPILILGTYRDVEARHYVNMEPLWRTERDAQVIRLSRLREQDVRDLLSRRKDFEATEERIGRLLKTTEGNPLFLIELVQLMQSANPGDFLDDRLPETVQQVIRQQIGLLPSTSAALLATASIQGRSFDPLSLSALAKISPARTEEQLEPALSAGLIRRFDGGQYRFSHTLHRDVLYQDIDPAERRRLHLDYAAIVQAELASNPSDRWSELARHLDAAGPEHRAKAIEAWRQAASQAMKRLAFDAAARQLKKALKAFGAGPLYSPKERCALLLECAEANLLAGYVEEGETYCRDAFSIARTLENAELMSSAALMWGSVFVAARVNKDLVAALRECLEQLPEQRVSLRAKVLARLAAAMQPATRPAEPMEMAREAITLARSTGDEEVLYQTLKSAMSALMDFASVAERAPLSRELAAFAVKFGDIPGRFRSHLRLMADAMEAGDREMLIEAIDACDELARRIDLPHYRWRAASARALQATIEGRFRDALEWIAEAQMHADRIEDAEARITLSCQRFEILIEWDSPEVPPLDEIRDRLRQAFDGEMPAAETYVAPMLGLFTAETRDDYARNRVNDPLFLLQVFNSGDRFLLGMTAHLAIQTGEKDLAERVFDKLLIHQNSCVSEGLMGSVWLGPVSLYLGRIAAALGRQEEALGYLNRALDMATAMGAQAWSARICRELAETEAALGRRQESAGHRETADRMFRRLQLRPRRLTSSPDGQQPAPPVAEADFSIDRQGEVWCVSFQGNAALVKDSKGLQMIFRLIERPECEIHVLDLSGGSANDDGGTPGAAIDPVARAQYKQRVRELNESLEEATGLGDLGRVEEIRKELDFITRELSRAFGLGGRKRPGGAAAERARVNVRRRIKDAIERIGEQLPGADRYLDNTIKTGTYCMYQPM